MSEANRFCWYELMTSDLADARRFYAEVTGWTVEDSGMQGMTYLIGKANGTMVAGLMDLPPNVQGVPPAWLGYVSVDDVDATLAKATAAGAQVYNGPMDVPGVGRFAVLGDPQGAAFAIFRFEEPAPEPAPMSPGHFGWNELHTTNWQAAFAFYSGLFGWQKDQAMDMGPMGTYQLFSVDGGAAVGGMMTNTEVPGPFWLYYITVDDIDAAMARIKSAGGSVVYGPQEVPGGSFIAHGRDPQGAFFAISGPRG
jgi:predicted enzyme related to lactoylglutathione lyase